MNGSIAEEVLTLPCGQIPLVGILSRPERGDEECAIGVVIVVGGPQYRVGSHRQFVLLARSLARQGCAVLRFDFRGMGDSDGETRSFEQIGPDLKAAVDALCSACPDLRRVAVWGLCDGASAAMMFAVDDTRVAGLVLVNPWARSEASLAITHVKHYYGARLLQAEFWTKLLRGNLDWRRSLQALAANLRAARTGRDSPPQSAGGMSFQTSMARGLARFQGEVLLILSGNDLTAREFEQYARSDAAWRGLLDSPRVTRVDIAQADHTFSRRSWLDRVESETAEWLKRLPRECNVPGTGGGGGRQRHDPNRHAMHGESPGFEKDEDV